MIYEILNVKISNVSKFDGWRLYELKKQKGRMRKEKKIL